MLRRVLKYIRDKELLEKGDRVLVCVSGGADSVALLDVLQRGGYDCVVAHCNFHLRGEESDRDERFVREVVEAYPLPLPKGKGDRLLGDEVMRLWVKDFDTVGYAQEKGISIEMAARELRYRWFAEVAAETGCKAIAVAHHQNDQAETVLLNLKRGTGIRGLCGMRAKSMNPYEVRDGRLQRSLVNAPEALVFSERSQSELQNGSKAAYSLEVKGERLEAGIPIIRPLLCTTRDYIEHYLRDIRKIDWVDDSTNTDTSIKRNAIREQLKHYTKAEIEHIAATAEHMQGYVDWLEGRESKEAGRAKLYEELKDYGFAEIDKIYDALQKGIGGKIFRSTTHQAEIRKGKIVVEKKIDTNQTDCTTIKI